MVSYYGGVGARYGMRAAHQEAKLFFDKRIERIGVVTHSGERAYVAR
jgi:hypothetical protein